jgi:hypothetical protein
MSAKIDQLMNIELDKRLQREKIMQEVREVNNLMHEAKAKMGK